MDQIQSYRFIVLKDLFPSIALSPNSRVDINHNLLTNQPTLISNGIKKMNSMKNIIAYLEELKFKTTVFHSSHQE